MIAREGYKRKWKDKQLFIKECQIIKSMDHPNIIKVYSLLDYKNYLLISMELCKLPLYALIKKRYKRKIGFTQIEI